MNRSTQKHRELLIRIARQAMLDRGLLPDFSTQALQQLEGLQEPARDEDGKARDLRGLLWCSIDNDDSKDLDQLTVAREQDDGRVNILVAVADVDSLAGRDTPIDEHARHNTTSVYTPAQIFPMLPEKLSTGLTSLNPGEDRLAFIIDMVIGADGSLQGSDIYRGMVHNQAQLAYPSVAAWLEGSGSMPEPMARVEGLADNLRLQDQVAQRMKHLRHIHGALSLETIQARPVFEDDQVLGLEVEERNRAKEIIEDFMIAANRVVARHLEEKRYPSIRRVVRTPKRWERIVEVAAEHGFELPGNPDSRALEKFLVEQKKEDPLRFPDLSLTVIKLLGAGEYVADVPGDRTPGHFGLAVKDYAHSTAPNRRFSDLVTQRIIKAALAGMPSPYGEDELSNLARHCTLAEDAADKVERQLHKSAAALFLEPRIGERFDGIITGAAAKGTWARLLKFPVEGKVVEGFEHLDVGHRVSLKLVHVDVEKGFIDFKRVR